MHALESWTFPSFPRRGGCAPPRNGPVPRWRSRGGSYPTHNHPGRSLGSRPPLLGKEGNVLDSDSFTPSQPRFRFIHAFTATIPIHSRLHSLDSNSFTPSQSRFRFIHAFTASIPIYSHQWGPGATVRAVL